MNKNALIIYHGIGGLHCECGNGEMITDAYPTYKTFYYTWSEKGATGKALGYCMKCNSDLQEPLHRNAPVDKRVQLLAVFGTRPQ